MFSSPLMTEGKTRSFTSIGFETRAQFPSMVSDGVITLTLYSRLVRRDRSRARSGEEHCNFREGWGVICGRRPFNSILAASGSYGFSLMPHFL
jgi:hypothetical protein